MTAWIGLKWGRGAYYSQPWGEEYPYFFALDDYRDIVSGNDLTDISAGSITYINSSGGLVTVQAGVPLFIPGYGITPVPNLDQSFVNPEAPATQTTDSLGTGFKTIWIENGTSVAISAGTATITGAGSATPGTPLTFEVTVAGTVDATVTGAVTRFNLTDQNYSTFPIYIDAVGSIASRAGTVSADSISTDFPKLLDALDGAADGPELVDNPVTVPGGWTDNLDGTFTCDGTSSDLEIMNILTDTLYYASEYEVVDVTSGEVRAIFIGLGTGAFASTTGIQKDRVIAGGANPNEALIYRSISFIGTIRPISIKQISPVYAALRTKIRFKKDADDLADGSYQLLSSDEVNGIQLYYFKSGATRELRAFDGINTASVTLDAVADTIYSVGLCYGYHIASAARKIQIDVDGTTGALADVEDAWPISNDAMVFGYNNDILTGLGEPSFSKTLWSGWRAQA